MAWCLDSKLSQSSMNSSSTGISLSVDPKMFQKMNVELEVDIEPCNSSSLKNAVHDRVQNMMLKLVTCEIEAKHI